MAWQGDSVSGHEAGYHEPGNEDVTALGKRLALLGLDIEIPQELRDDYRGTHRSEEIESSVGVDELVDPFLKGSVDEEAMTGPDPLDVDRLRSDLGRFMTMSSESRTEVDEAYLATELGWRASKEKDSPAEATIDPFADTVVLEKIQEPPVASGPRRWLRERLSGLTEKAKGLITRRTVGTAVCAFASVTCLTAAQTTDMQDDGPRVEVSQQLLSGRESEFPHRSAPTDIPKITHVQTDSFVVSQGGGGHDLMHELGASPRVWDEMVKDTDLSKKFPGVFYVRPGGDIGILQPGELPTEAQEFIVDYVGKHRAG
ncbi:MAG: hypothetical protein JWL85_338 [Candidatus Saccharibacteria bacterium]|nr:hypothetical protein [Candidatus Saccharibacteria bacterium]